MHCLVCNCSESKVINSRSTDNGAIRRRRECVNCGARWTTYERREMMPIMVVKKDNTRQPFERQKILKGLIHATQKRPISMTDLESLVDNIEIKLQQENQDEVPASKIGELVMEELKTLDQVAYVRFASVYKHFQDVATFKNELEMLQNDTNN
ncbi:MAG: transcriptional regulator NrdR [Clostridiales bacterium]|nr:transcriptional regulator NrdR [Clostridiales bacterium]